jgi:hypothetical protein
MGSPSTSGPPTEGHAVAIERLPGSPFFWTKSAFVPVALGLVLLVAAGLKGYELATGPAGERDLWRSHPVRVGVVELELGLGLWLLSGYRPCLARWAALVLFIAFSSFTLFRAVTGETSCGCFGQVPIDPWYMLCFDLAAVAVLLAWRPTPAQPIRSGQPCRQAVVLSLLIVVCVPAGIAIARYRPTELGSIDDVDMAAEGQIVLLEPDRWIGRPFPLRKFTDIGDELTRGRWVVVLHRLDCRKCQEEIPRYQQTARAMAGDSDAPRIAFIEVPPHAGNDSRLISSEGPWRVSVLRDVRRWFVTTPSVLYLTDGVVEPASQGEAWLPSQWPADP